MFYLICYDIPNNKRRKKIADLLAGYGNRVQYSVFECTLKRQQYRQLQQRLKKIFKAEEDNIRFYPISSHTLSQTEAWGIGQAINSESGSILI